MKPTLLSFAVLPLALTVGLAGPLDRRQVAADAKWVLHLDGDALLKTQVGNHFVEKMLEPKTAEHRQNLQTALEFDLDWRKVQGLTAYGRTFQPAGDGSGLLLIQTSLKVQAALEQAQSRNYPWLRVEKIESPAAPLFRLNDQAYVSLAPGGRILVGKTQETVEAGRAVLDGKAPSLAGSTALAGYPEAPKAFCFVAVAEGFADRAPIPQQAAMLRNAKGARLTVGEADQKVVFNLDVRLVSAEVAQQVQQIAQGLVALAALNATQKPELQALAQSSAVTVANDLVSVGAKVPVADVIQKLNSGR